MAVALTSRSQDTFGAHVGWRMKNGCSRGSPERQRRQRLLHLEANEDQRLGRFTSRPTKGANMPSRKKRSRRRLSAEATAANPGSPRGWVAGFQALGVTSRWSVARSERIGRRRSLFASRKSQIFATPCFPTRLPRVCKSPRSTRSSMLNQSTSRFDFEEAAARRSLRLPAKGPEVRSNAESTSDLTRWPCD
jgi:hypothetical protein